MTTCQQQTLSNPYVQFALHNWQYIVIGLLLLWIVKRGVK